jgi:hypothetical protein
MTSLAASIVQLWVRLYTVGFEANERDRVRQEVEADIWEQINCKDASSKPIKEAVIIILRWMLGIPADVRRAVEESRSGGLSMWTKKFLGVLAQRRFWLVLLIVLGFSLSIFFLGIAALVALFIILLCRPKAIIICK